jgi:hypothetical protein
MSEYDDLLKGVEKLEAKINERTAAYQKEIEPFRLAYEKDVQPWRIAVNAVLAVAGQPPRYQDEDNKVVEPATGSGGFLQSPTVKADEFFNKPLATAVRSALVYLRGRNQAPASIDTIYDLLVLGGFNFPTRGKEAAIQSLSISIGKNSEVFAKVGNGLIGLREWYGPPASRQKRTRSSSGSEPPANGEEGLDPEQTDDDKQRAAGQQEGTT